MAICYTCKKFVVFGGVKDHGFRFCSKICHAQKVVLLASMAAVQPADIEKEAAKIRNSKCPCCDNVGNIDFHKSLSIWSLIFITNLKEHVLVSCNSCARRVSLINTFKSLLMGWWGIPVGIVGTPVVIAFNLSQIIFSSLSTAPSKRLNEYARERIAAANPLPYTKPSFLKGL
jgi:hypothetical protein